MVNSPTVGHDYLVQLNYQPNKLFGMYVRFRNKDKTTDESGNGIIYFPQDQLKQNLRFHLFQQLSPAFSINNRVEMLWFNHQLAKNELGFLSYVEANYDGKRFSANLGLQYFETNSYDSRIYAYESDVLYSFSIPAFYDKGFSYYINFHYSLTHKMDCYIRGAQTIYTNKTVVGSSLDEIDRNKKIEIKTQFLYSFKLKNGRLSSLNTHQ